MLKITSNLAGGKEVWVDDMNRHNMVAKSATE